MCAEWIRRARRIVSSLPQNKPDLRSVRERIVCRRFWFPFPSSAPLVRAARQLTTLNTTNYRSNKNGRVFRDNSWKSLLKSASLKTLCDSAGVSLQDNSRFHADIKTFIRNVSHSINLDQRRGTQTAISNARVASDGSQSRVALAVLKVMHLSGLSVDIKTEM